MMRYFALFIFLLRLVNKMICGVASFLLGLFFRVHRNAPLRSPLALITVRVQVPIEAPWYLGSNLLIHRHNLVEMSFSAFLRMVFGFDGMFAL